MKNELRKDENEYPVITHIVILYPSLCIIHPIIFCGAHSIINFYVFIHVFSSANEQEGVSGSLFADISAISMQFYLNKKIIHAKIILEYNLLIYICIQSIILLSIQV